MHALPADSVSTPSSLLETTLGQDGSDPQRVYGKRHLTTWNLFTLSLGMAGAQVAWTIELGYVPSHFFSWVLNEIFKIWNTFSS